MSADPRKMAALAMESLPPPDRLKKRKPPMVGESAEGEVEDEEMGGADAAGIMAMEDFEAATSPKEKFAALKRAVQACSDYE